MYVCVHAHICAPVICVSVCAGNKLMLFIYTSGRFGYTTNLMQFQLFSTKQNRAHMSAGSDIIVWGKFITDDVPLPVWPGDILIWSDLSITPLSQWQCECAHSKEQKLRQRPERGQVMWTVITISTLLLPCGKFGHPTWRRLSSPRAALTIPISVCSISVSKQWYGCQCLGFGTHTCDCTQGVAWTLYESALEIDSGSKIPCYSGDSNWHQHCVWLFNLT